MDMPLTLQALARNPELCAWRDRFIVIRIRPGLVIERVFVKKPYRWVPAFGDLIAVDWQTGTFDQAMAHFRELSAEAEPCPS